MSKGTKRAQTKSENRIARYLKETRAELRKVTWPTRKEATNLSLIVLAATVAMALFLGAIDFLFATLMQWIVS